MTKVRFLRASYFVWVIVPLAAYAFYLSEGLPHVIWSYDWQQPAGASYGDFALRRYTRCTYAGPYGLLTEYPTDGTCGWVRFVRKAEGRT